MTDPRDGSGSLLERKEQPRFAELFAGAGGLSMGLERAGWECAEWYANA